MFALADPTQVFNFNNSTLDSTVIKVEAQAENNYTFVKQADATEVTTTVTWNGDGFGYSEEKAITGLAKDKSNVYYLSNGVKVTGLVPVGSDYYYFDEESGKAVTGLVTIADNTYYFGKNGKRVSNDVVKVGTVFYHFDKDGVMEKSRIATISGHSEDLKLADGDYCFREDGSLVTSGLCTATIGNDEKLYTFYVNAKEVKGDTEGGADQKAKQIVKSHFKLIEGSIYYFNKDGKMVTGVQKIGGSEKTNTIDGTTNNLGNKKSYGAGTYYFNASGEMQTGLTNVSKIDDYVNAGIYYFGDNGAAVEGLQIIDSKRYYFRTNKDLESNKYKQYTAVVGTFTDKNGKISKNKADYYFNENGEMVTGFQTIDGVMYYYSEETLTIGQKVKATTGKKVKKTINGMDYVFDDQGIIQTNNFSDIDDKTYYYDENGQVVKGWISHLGKTYYASLKTGEILTGFQTIDGTKYYFSTGSDGTKGLNGQTATKGEMLKGVQEISKDGSSKKEFYFLGENTGRVVTGWVTADKDGKNYYMDENGVVQTKLININGSTYYLDPNSKDTGAMANGAMATGLTKVNDSEDYDGTYYFGKDGIMKVGFQNINGHMYYFDEQYSNRGKMVIFSGSDGNMPEINGEKYFFDSNGQIATGWVTLNKTTENLGDTYYMNERGVVQTGWQTIDGTTYYFDKDTGKLLRGINEIDGEHYFLGENTGRVVTGLVTADAKDEKGNRKVFYMNSRGVIQTGFITINGTTYYFSETGTAALDSTAETKGQMIKGIKQINGKNYFLGENTGRVVTGWVTADMKDEKGNNMIFYMNERGVIQTGFQTIDSTTYYFSKGNKTTDNGEEVGQMLKGIQKINDKIYFLGENTGRLVTGLITADAKDSKGNNMIFYMNGKGEIQTGFQTIDGTTYYFDSNSGVDTFEEGKDTKGRMLKGIQEIGGTTYFLGENTGRLVTGWITADKDGRRYYMDGYGVIQTGLKTIDGKKYYFNEKGQMEVNTAYKDEDDGDKMYIIDENGVATEQTDSEEV